MWSRQHVVVSRRASRCDNRHPRLDAVENDLGELSSVLHRIPSRERNRLDRVLHGNHPSGCSVSCHVALACRPRTRVSRLSRGWFCRTSSSVGPRRVLARQPDSQPLPDPPPAIRASPRRTIPRHRHDYWRCRSLRDCRGGRGRGRGRRLRCRWTCFVSLSPCSRCRCGWTRLSPGVCPLLLLFLREQRLEHPQC